MLDKTNVYSPMHVEEIHENNVCEEIHENNAFLFLLVLLFSSSWKGSKCNKTQAEID